MCVSGALSDTTERQEIIRRLHKAGAELEAKIPIRHRGSSFSDRYPPPFCALHRPPA
jgi:hypothetical protein